MQEQRERSMQLCEQAATEQDPEKLMALITEINRLLEKPDQALIDFSEALELGPQDPWLFERRGRVYQSLQDFSQL